MGDFGTDDLYGEHRDSAARPAVEAPELTREPLDGASPAPRHLPGRRPILNALSALAALALIIFLIATALSHLPRSRPSDSGATPTALAAVRASATAAAAATIDAGHGWLAAGPPEAQTIAFAPSDPLTAYTCGVSHIVTVGGAGPIVVEVSHDGAATWVRRSVPAVDQICQLSVDPQDAADVVLLTFTNPTQSTFTNPTQSGPPPPATLYRSFDGGASWSVVSPPPRAPGNVGAISYFQFAWSGGALFVAPYYIGENGYTRLAASRHGGGLAWLDTTALLAGWAEGASINRLFSTSGSLYVEVNRNIANCLSDCFRVRRSRDGGATWEDFAPRIDGAELYVLDAQPDRRLLYGDYYVAPDGSSRGYARSEDDGATWTPFPPLPTGLSASPLVTTPLGYTYAATWNVGSIPAGGSLGIYVLAPGAAQWRFVAPHSQGFTGLLAISWDAQGRASALWSTASPPTQDAPGIGLVRHSP